MVTLNAETIIDIDAAQFRHNRGIMLWLGVLAIGLIVTALAVATGAPLGTAAAPFLGHYRVNVTAASAIAPVIAGLVLYMSTRARSAQWRWTTLLVMSYLAAFTWSVGLAVTQGQQGLTAYLSNSEGYRPHVGDIDSVSALMSVLSNNSQPSALDLNGHPPAMIAVLWSTQQLPLPTGAIALIWAALAAATVPLVLTVAKLSCGQDSARQLAPLMILAPYSIWTTVGPQGLTATAVAAALAAAAYASHRCVTGGKAFGWAVTSGFLLTVATMFAYVVAWFGLSIVWWYFSRRRPWHSLGAGLGVLAPVLLLQIAGFNWATGLEKAYHWYLAQVATSNSLGWWLALSVVATIIATGPAAFTSLARLHRSPAWPMAIGALAAIVFSLAIGIARGGAEQTWLPFFPWLMIAATASSRGEPKRTASALPLAATSAVTAIGLQAVLVSPW